MKMEKRLGEKGITLIELLIALVIGGIVVAGIYRVFVSQSRAYVVQDQVVEVQQNIRSAMEMLLKDLRMAGFNGDNTPCTPSVTPGPDNITIYYLKNGVMLQVRYLKDGAVLRRTETPGIPPSEPNGEPILTDVNSLDFKYGVDPDEDGVVKDTDWKDALSVGTSKVIAVQVDLRANPAPVNPDMSVITPRRLQSRVTLRNLCLR